MELFALESRKKLTIHFDVTKTSFVGFEGRLQAVDSLPKFYGPGFRVLPP